jgi:hypothetical protein
VVKATKVDGVYTADPTRDPTARRYSKLTFDEAIVKNLKVMDATALALCRDQNMLLKVFSIFVPGALKRVVMGAEKAHSSTADSGRYCGGKHDDRRHQEVRRAEDGQVGGSAQGRSDQGPHRTRPHRASRPSACRITTVIFCRSANVPTSRSADARTIVVQPWEKKMVPVIEKAIRDSDLGLNPSTSGDLIRVPMPALTEERRRDLIKVVRP